MARQMYFEEYNIPEYAVSYLEYGETDDRLTEEDIRNIGEFLEKIQDAARENFYFSHIDYGNEDPFLSYNPAFGLPANCYSAKVVYFNKI